MLVPCRRGLPLRVLALLFPLAAAATVGAAHAGEDAPQGWTTEVKRLEGSERGLWYLGLVTRESARHVTLLVAPVEAAGTERDGTGDAETMARSAAGDLHQIALWAEHLRKEAEGWKRPSLRDRPPASAHVIGVVRSASGRATVENAEHGGGDLAVGDLLFVEDVLRASKEGSLGIEVMGAENTLHFRVLHAHLLLGRGAHVGLRSREEGPLVHLHGGTALVDTHTGGLRLRTRHQAYTPTSDTVLLLTSSGDERLDVRAGSVTVNAEDAATVVAAGTALTTRPDAAHAVAALDEARWAEVAPEERTCTRDEALRLVARTRAWWRSQHPRSASITLSDDGQWRSYERFPGRSVNKQGTWEPRPGGVVELTYVFTPRRSKTTRTDVFRYRLAGNALVRLRPAGAVFLKAPPK